MKPISFEPIGTIHSCFREKFGVPRQSLMVDQALGVLKLKPDARYRDALRYLEDFSHVWIIFLFHEHLDSEWRPTITPPRVDAPGKVGVFASRSPHRPNSIGMSAVKLESIQLDAPGGIEIHLSGVDLLEGTPVLDIKPYLPYVDCIPEARGGWTETRIPKYPVHFSDESLVQINEAASRNASHYRGNLKRLIEQMLELDPRPTSQRKSMPIENESHEGKAFAYRMLDFDVKWEIQKGGVWVRELKRLS